jgi:hypothetical protein
MSVNDELAARMSRMAQAKARPIDTSKLGPVTVLPPRSIDDDASALLDELSRLQSWCVMQLPTPGAMQAADLVQRTRILIIERCKRPSKVQP